MVLAATCAAYANHFRNGFHFDDAHTVVNNVFIRDLGNIPRFFADATTFSALPANQAYRPVVSTSLAIDYRLGGGVTPFFFHLSTFLLFLAQGVLMYLLLRRIFSRAAPGEDPDPVAILAVAWYLLHPANAETINYVIARGDSISTLFVVLCVLLYAAPAARRRHLYLAPATLAVFAKPVSAVFPMLLLAYELLFGEAAAGMGRARRSSRWTAALRATGPAFAWAALLLLLVGRMSPKSWTPGGTSFLGYVITQPLVVARYAGSLLFPLGLSADTDWQLLESVADPRFAGGLLACALLLAAGLAASRRVLWRPAAFGIFWFFIALLPTSLFFPLAEVTNDHRIFFPFVGLVPAAAWTASRLVRRLGEARRTSRAVVVTGAVTLLLLAAYGYGTHRRNDVWRTEETLWRDVTAKSPGNGRGWMNYGLALMGRGEYAGAEEAYRRALALVPNYLYLHVNLGVLREATGRFAEAEAFFKRALELGPDNPEGYVFYAGFLAVRQRRGEAVALLRRALALAPGHVDASRRLLALLAGDQDPRPLEALARETLRVDPADSAARGALADLASRGAAVERARAAAERLATPEAFLALSLQAYRAGEFAGAIRAAERSLALRPGYAPAYNNICASWNSLGEWEKAIFAGERAVALDPASELARNNLAWARRRGVSNP